MFAQNIYREKYSYTEEIKNYDDKCSKFTIANLKIKQN